MAARHDARGFVLLEVLIAFVIAAIALGVMFRVALDGVGSARVASQYEEALSRARSHLDGSFPALVPGDHQGDDGGGYHWRMLIRAMGEAPGRLAGASQESEAPSLMVRLYAITVWISWERSGRTREVRLDSERLTTVAPSG